MKKFRVLIGSLILVTASFLSVGLAYGHSIKSGNNVTVGQNEKIDNTLFAYGKTIDINSEVQGDVFCAGQNVTISGTVHGDVVCAGQTVTVSGTVEGDVRLAGQNVTLRAVVNGNASIAGQSFILESSGKVGGDLSTGASDVTLNGSVGRDLAVGGGNVVVANTVGRNTKATTTTLEFAAGAVVGGNVEYTSEKEAVVASTAKIAGTVVRTEPAKHTTSKKVTVVSFGVGSFIYCLLAMLFASLLLVLLFPKAVHAACNRAMPRPWKAMLTGFVATIVAPFVLFLLVITIVGIPAALFAGMAWLVVCALSGPLFAYYIGRQVLPSAKNALVVMLVGAPILTILFFVPFIGFITMLISLWVGVGMFLLQVFRTNTAPRYQITPVKK